MADIAQQTPSPQQLRCYLTAEDRPCTSPCCLNWQLDKMRTRVNNLIRQKQGGHDYFGLQSEIDDVLDDILATGKALAEREGDQ